MSVVSAFLLCLILVSVNCQIPDGCVDCGLPDRPHCDFGKCTETCSWCINLNVLDMNIVNFTLYSIYTFV